MPNHYLPEQESLRRYFTPVPHLTYNHSGFDDMTDAGGFVFFFHDIYDNADAQSVVIDTYKNASFLAHVMLCDGRKRVYESIALLVKDLEEVYVDDTLPSVISITAAAFELHKTVQARANTGDQIALCHDCGGDDGFELVNGPLATHTAFVEWYEDGQANVNRYCSSCAEEYDEHAAKTACIEHVAIPTGRTFITHDEIDEFWRERL